MLNITQLRKLLIIPDHRKETIYGVVGRMEGLLELFKSDNKYSNLIPFLETYYLVTKASSSKYVQYRRYFRNMKDHEALDVYFASLYFEPVLKYLETGEAQAPWKQYFLYCRKPGGIPFLQMLLGINAHINADLYTAIIDLKYKHQHDFFIVNDILLEVIPSVMRYLAVSRHDLVGTLGVVMKDFITNEFHMVIERWRSEAWANALLTNFRDKKARQDIILKNTENMGKKLIQDFEAMYHLKNIGSIVSDINRLSVNAL